MATQHVSGWGELSNQKTPMFPSVFIIQCNANKSTNTISLK